METSAMDSDEQQQREAMYARILAKLEELVTSIDRNLGSPSSSVGPAPSPASAVTASRTLATTLTGDHKMVDEMPPHCEVAIHGDLHVMVSHVVYPVTEEVLHCLFDPYGAEKVHVLKDTNHVEALVSFHSAQGAIQAREACHGRCIWDGCNVMDIYLVLPDASCSMPENIAKSDNADSSGVPVVAMYLPTACVSEGITTLQETSPVLTEKLFTNAELDNMVTCVPQTVEVVAVTLDAIPKQKMAECAEIQMELEDQISKDVRMKGFVPVDANIKLTVDDANEHAAACHVHQNNEVAGCLLFNELPSNYDTLQESCFDMRLISCCIGHVFEVHHTKYMEMFPPPLWKEKEWKPWPLPIELWCVDSNTSSRPAPWPSFKSTLIEACSATLQSYLSWNLGDEVSKHSDANNFMQWLFNEVPDALVWMLPCNSKCSSSRTVKVFALDPSSLQLTIGAKIVISGLLVFLLAVCVIKKSTLSDSSITWPWDPNRPWDPGILTSSTQRDIHMQLSVNIRLRSVAINKQEVCQLEGKLNLKGWVMSYTCPSTKMTCGACYMERRRDTKGRVYQARGIEQNTRNSSLSSSSVRPSRSPTTLAALPQNPCYPYLNSLQFHSISAMYPPRYPGTRHSIW